MEKIRSAFGEKHLSQPKHRLQVVCDDSSRLFVRVSTAVHDEDSPLGLETRLPHWPIFTLASQKGKVTDPPSARLLFSAPGI